MLGGRLDVLLERTTHRLGLGDCLRYRLSGASRFSCPGPEAARYVIAICKP